jgi:uncharacterized membrane protein YvbJ
MDCPRCGVANAEGVQFCTNCHATLFFKCPKCEHTQAHGIVCEKCGTNFAQFWAIYMTQKSAENDRLESDKVKAAERMALQMATLPFAAGAGLSRFLIWQVISRAISYFRAR